MTGTSTPDTPEAHDPGTEDLARRLCAWSGDIWCGEHHCGEAHQWFAYADLLTRLADLRAARPVTVTEYGLRASDGAIHTGEDEGLRWTREEALAAADADPDDGATDVLVSRRVVTSVEQIGEWTEA